jgi:cytidylate kinase
MPASSNDTSDRPPGRRLVVAVDGPSGSGKSSVSREVAARLGLRYLDTGAMYRALTWLARQRGISLGNGEQLGELAAEHPVGFDEHGRVWIADTDVTSSIRKADIDSLVPVVARHQAVRRVMRERQQELADDGSVVIEGRDIGTVVAPQAEVKIYLNADRAIRANRRLAERPEIGADALATDLRLRDESDAARMRPAEDAMQIDTTDLDVEDVVAQIEELVRARQPA